MHRILSAIILLFSSLLLSGCGSSSPLSSLSSEATPPLVTTGTDTLPARAPHPLLDALSIPSGFQIDIFAEVPNARSLEIVETPDKMVVFVGNKDKSSVYAAIDTNHDRKADEVKQIATQLHSPNGVAYRDGTLYVAEIDRILAFPEILQHLDDPIYEVVYDNLPHDTHHGRKYISFGPDENLYIPIGAPCNICNAGTPYASLRKLDMTTKERVLVAEGIRNTVGFDRHPQTHELRFTDNGRDWAGNDQPPDELNKITHEKENFGYPFCHGGTLQDTQFTSRPCSEFTPPEVSLDPHVAALGMKFYTGTQFPEQYQGSIFIAEHGSRNRTPPIGYRIMQVDPTKKTYLPFATGRLQGTRTLGRPVDIKQLSDGSLLVSDDYAGLIYRIWYDPMALLTTQQ